MVCARLSLRPQLRRIQIQRKYVPPKVRWRRSPTLTFYELKERFSAFEQRINKNTTDIKDVQEEMKGLVFQVKETEDEVKSMDTRQEKLKRKN